MNITRLWLSLCWCVCLTGSGWAAEGTVDFQRDILPILSDHCLACHGPDEAHREAGLRLDDQASATAELDSGVRAIVPGDADSSELLRRIESADSGEQMPPPDGKPLSAVQKQLLRAWIAAGAEYSQHWAFVPPERPALPDGINSDWCRTAIDHFVAERHAANRLAPAGQAGREVLIRRLSYDLTGLPPTPEQIAEFVSDPAPDAYEQLVERLLASPHFGERMAMFWLDAARYSDTDGFQGDATRTNWPWRDWVIRSLNRNMPLDQFTLEQFAGDLLTGATAEQRLATCFHRNHMTNGEGGRDPEESRIDYVIDRVNTTGTVWLGLTLGCCQCHSHKYDPISHEDYYSLSAFFNNIDEDGRAGGGAKPFLEWKSDDAQSAVAEARQWLAHQEARLAAARERAAARLPLWLEQQWTDTRGGYSSWHPLVALQLDSEAGSVLSQEEHGIIQASGLDPHHEDYHVAGATQLGQVTGLKLEVLPHASHTGGAYSPSESGHFVLSDIKLRLRRSGEAQLRDVRLTGAVADYEADPGQHGGYGKVQDALDDDPRNGWASFGAKTTEPRVAVFQLDEPLAVSPDDVLIVELQQRALQGRHNIGRFRLSLTSEFGMTTRTVVASPREQLAAAAAGSLAEVDETLRASLFEQLLAEDPDFVRARLLRDRAAAQLTEAQAAAGNLQVMVLAERAEPRETHVLLRGVWDQKGKVVQRGVPSSVMPWPDDLPRDRMGLARWLTDRRNPLTARVMANHVWGLLFGAGLVRTPEDFGVQGERPTHPELLDWLAVELMEADWDLKHLVRSVVHSATYRQQSDAAPADYERDPDNRWLARGARFRLPSWMIRDGALQAAGLLNSAVGGPPVRPYQPPGIWADITMGRYHYEPSEGPARYRRTIYAFWRRSAAPAFLFDTAQRRVCEVRTYRTNTPLQALALLNDLARLEAARALAADAQASSSELGEQLRHLFLRILSRHPQPAELETLTTNHHLAAAYYGEHPEQLGRFMESGQVPEDLALDSPHLAALTVVASMILNLDEAVTRE